MKYKSQEVVSLDKAVAELTPDKDTVATWLSAVLEYYIKLTVRCVARPKTLKDRKARREAEIAGLKQTLDVSENETAFVQRNGTLSMTVALLTVDRTIPPLMANLSHRHGIQTR